MPQDKTNIKQSKGWIIPAIRYAWITTKHKYFVLRAGIKIGCPIWRLITHDLSKYGPKELLYYGRQFFGDGKRQESFGKAWLHHQNTNDHHWEYWMPRTKHDQDKNTTNTIPMTEGAVLEMLSDWFGASRAYDGNWPVKGKWPWFDNNFFKIELHYKTRQMVIEKLTDMDMSK